MNLDQRIAAFARLGDYLRNLPKDDFNRLAENAQQENPWFTPDNVQRALTAVSAYLQEDKLNTWAHRYAFSNSTVKTIALILAGNIPLVGFHDLLCVLISGNRALIKYSHKDRQLTEHLMHKLTEFEPAFADRIILTDGPVKNFDAVIATGSDNSARYFQYYFGRYPHIIRKNRVSVAVLSGNETQQQLENLGEDVFSYFGLGCRNVAKIFVPRGFDLFVLRDAWKKFESVIYHHKYANNYDYQKSVFLVNREPFTDFGFALLKESEQLVSPVSVIYWQPYHSMEEVAAGLEVLKDKIQCYVGNMAEGIGFGKAQYPELDDYADGIDALQFLQQLSA
ncbi:MAG: acyl-CoA reductase [Cyclobacteriaceae bacterium]|nr:MAG: acyl-CoA reductase [Cyclobacteriaceae bacterium]